MNSKNKPDWSPETTSPEITERSHKIIKKTRLVQQLTLQPPRLGGRAQCCQLKTTFCFEQFTPANRYLLAMGFIVSTFHTMTYSMTKNFLSRVQIPNYRFIRTPRNYMHNLQKFIDNATESYSKEELTRWATSGGITQNSTESTYDFNIKMRRKRKETNQNEQKIYLQQQQQQQQ